MKIAILGGSGFIGTALREKCRHVGHEVVILSRDLKYMTRTGTLEPLDPSCPLIVDGVVNLAGETINQRWTNQAKKRIQQSRIQTTRSLAEMIANGAIQTPTVINGSAVGFYGHSDKQIFSEESSGSKDVQDFLAQVVATWEAEADQMAVNGVRVVKARFGIVLGLKGGALPKMLNPYRFYIGGPIGKGNQWLSWIHIDDAVNLLLFCMEQEKIFGAVNFTAPTPVTMNEFGEQLSQILKRPHWLRTPALALRMALGEMADLLLKGQKVFPKKAVGNGFTFQYSHLPEALSNLIENRKEHGYV
ncbi:TIGR01777 family oxidoreductase [Ammoniphilus resinae]|uniref:Uncharacterized protein (TIGR01777 family) n=1 Tax=Ammoniphilus resinae TaxID=861532 RepID=A0ABS4GLL0_9BACL|nr:TIGR01777 family oxidoreductase [Ammoniphilus resinae]MBP1931160.1 uncharacterized protein (TIGR01777 family) [Ammoniphilus resinae]